MSLDPETFDALIATVRRFVAERLRPLEAQVAEEDEVPAEIVREMREMGLFGLSIPEEYGGLGLTMSEEVRVALEFGRTTPAFRSVFGTNVGIGSQGLVMAGSDEQKARWLPGIASGEIVTSFCLTEPGAGSDGASVQTHAVAEGETYRLTGSKRFITNADKASLFTVMARTGGEGAKGVSAFLVPADLPGVSVGKPEKKMGQQGAHVCDVHFDDVAGPGGQPARRGRRGLQDRDARARSRPAAYRRGLRRHLRAADRRRGRLCGRAQAIRQAARRLPADPGDDR